MPFHLTVIHPKLLTIFWWTTNPPTTRSSLARCSEHGAAFNSCCISRKWFWFSLFGFQAFGLEPLYQKWEHFFISGRTLTIQFYNILRRLHCFSPFSWVPIRYPFSISDISMTKWSSSGSWYPFRLFLKSSVTWPFSETFDTCRPVQGKNKLSFL